MPTHEELHEQQRRQEYVDALKVEHAGYVRYSRNERADAVADALAGLGVKVERQAKAKPKRATGSAS